MDFRIIVQPIEQYSGFFQPMEDDAGAPQTMTSTVKNKKVEWLTKRGINRGGGKSR